MIRSMSIEDTIHIEILMLPIGFFKNQDSQTDKTNFYFKFFTENMDSFVNDANCYGYARKCT